MRPRTSLNSLALPFAFALACCSRAEEIPQKEPMAAVPASPASFAVDAAPPGVDASFLSAIALDAGLTAREDEDLASLLTSLYAPCSSEAMTVAQCVAENRPCRDCGRAARYLAIGFHEGWSSVYAQKAFQSRFGRKESPGLPTGGSPVRGPASAAVTIVEFGSYVCPHCALEAPKLDALQKAHPKDVRLVFKPMWSPQDEGQVRATRAALAAASQGKFWEMHAALFAHQPQFDAESIDGYATSLGLDLSKLHVEMQAPTVTAQMGNDMQVAAAAGVDSLPSIWINGRPYLAFEDLDTRVAFELGEARGDGGTKR
jgi:thiol-disulfide isomerase/thioredoxin